MFSLKRSKPNRIGTLKTNHGEITTPFFMPDATKAVVRSLKPSDLRSVGINPMVVNTYHLYLQPGPSLIEHAGGIHEFMNDDGPKLSDSGGYQVYSLIHKNPEMGKISESGATFRSVYDGSLHELTPEKSIQIQFAFGVDMMVVLDDPRPNNAPKKEFEDAVERTIRWAKRCKEEYNRQINDRYINEEERPLLFGVVQGGPYNDLRKRCMDGLLENDFDGYGFGGRHVDQKDIFMENEVTFTGNLIPEDKPRFALGVGTPTDIIKMYQRGWDMFDCVIPTREGRHGRLFVWKEEKDIELTEQIDTINIENATFREEFTPLSETCNCPLCKNHTIAYLHHLFRAKDPLAQHLSSLHNLQFYKILTNKLSKTQNLRTKPYHSS